MALTGFGGKIYRRQVFAKSRLDQWPGFPSAFERMKLPLLLFSMFALLGCVNTSSVGKVEDFAVVEAFLSTASAQIHQAPQSRKITVPVTHKRSLVQLEAEELRIRRDPSLTPSQRMQKLRDIWKQQLAVMGK